MMKVQIKIVMFLLINMGLMTLPYSVLSQNKVHVVTKKIEQQLEFKAGESLMITAEKANINVEAWSGDYIDIMLKLISKHPNEEIAKKELAYIGYKLEKAAKGHSIKNYFDANGRNARIKGNLLFSYTIKVPYECALDVTNLYGTLYVSGIRSNLKSRVRFVEFTLKDHHGGTMLESFFSDLTVENYKGHFTGSFEKSKLRMAAFKGQIDIKSNYGEIEIEGGTRDALNINSNKTKVSFNAPNLTSYNYRLQNKQGKIILPNSLGNSEISTDGNMEHYDREFNQSNTSIFISTSYSTIVLRETSN